MFRVLPTILTWAPTALQQDDQGRWNVFTSTGIESRKSFHGIMDWQGGLCSGLLAVLPPCTLCRTLLLLHSAVLLAEGWAITLGDQFSDGTGERGLEDYWLLVFRMKAEELPPAFSV